MRSQPLAVNPAGTKALAPRTIGYNVRDFGAVGDGVTDDTLAFQRALTAAGPHGTLLVPDSPGSYRIDLDTGSSHPNITGAGPRGATVQPFTSGGAAISFGPDNTDGYWQFAKISNLCFTGPAGTRTDTGFRFGHAVYESGDEYAGRVIFEHCKFIDLNICVHKPFGNIANRYRDCIFGNANYHYYAQSHPSMHAGADIFDGCHFGNSQLASSYIDSSLDGTGQIVWRDAIWEGNVGFVWFVKAFENTGIGAGLVIAGGTGWQEANATAATVTINGTVYTVNAVIAYLNNVRSARIEGLSLNPNRLRLYGYTHLDVDGACVGDIDGQIDVQDAGATYVVHRAVADDSRVHPYTRFVSRVKQTTGNFLGHFEVPQRVRVSHEYQGNLRFSIAGLTPLTTTGVVATTATRADGLLFDACQELAATAWGQTFYLPGAFSLTAGRFIAWTIECMLLSGDAPSEIRFTATTRSIVQRLASRWKTFGGIGEVGGNVAGAVLDFVSAASGTAFPVVRFGACQMLEFTTKQEALEFLDARVFVTRQADVPRAIHGTAAPTTGTWSVGDRCANTVPAVGSPKGWICTAAGTPGTWVSEGNL